MREYYPFSYGYILTSIIGFLISAVYVAGIDKTWGFTFSIFFAVMFIASMVSLNKITAEIHVKKDKERVLGKK